MKAVNLAIVGATGQVGEVLLDILKQREFNIAHLRLFASSKSAGKTIVYNNVEYIVEDLSKQTSQSLKGIDIAIFSAGSSVSIKYAPVFANADAIVIDNSSAWRKNEQIPLVVSEVNPDDIDEVFEPNSQKIIANPNCTTMAAMPVLAPLHKQKKLKRLVISTYQAVSGMGVSGVKELEASATEVIKQDASKLVRNGNTIDFLPPVKFPAPIAFNVIPYAGNLVDDNSLETDEEQKLRNESKKILHAPNLKVMGTCVRVPVFSGHSLSITAEFENEITPLEAVEILKNASGVQVMGSSDASKVAESLNALKGSGVEVSGDGAKAGASVAGVPTPLLAAGKDDSFVGRIRQDYSLDNNNGLTMFTCGDNLRKGAALNTVQIAEIIANKL